MGQIKTGCSTACLYPMEAERALSALLAFDCKYLELFINCRWEIEKGFLRELRRQGEAIGARFTSVHPYTSMVEGMLLFGDYPRRTKEGFALYRQYLEGAAVLGAPYVVIHGTMVPGNSPGRGWSEERYFRRMGALYDMGLEIGAVPAQENVVNHLSGTPDFIRRMRASLGDRCAFVLDLKQCRRAGVTVSEMLDAMGDRLVHIHLSDFSEEEKKDCLLPGQGEMDLSALRNCLEARDYRGTMVTEVYRDCFSDAEELKRSYDFVKTVF